MAIFFILGVIGVAVVAGLIYLAINGARGSHGPRYQGEAPHKGPVMRFTGMGSEVKEDKGNQPTTSV